MNKKIIIIIVIIIVCSLLIFSEKLNKNSYENIQSDNIVENIDNSIENTAQEVEEKEYIKIHITGQINSPGIIELEEGARIADAIEKSGGATALANLENVNLAYELQDGQKVYIPSMEEGKVEYLTEESGENIIEDTSAFSKTKKININKASEEDLQNIPGIGPSMAQKIVIYRKENGEFKSIEDLKNVSGIGDKKFESMREYISIK